MTNKALKKEFFGFLEKSTTPNHEDFLNKQNRRINDIDTDLVKMENTPIDGNDAHKSLVNSVVSGVCDAMEEVRRTFIHLQNGTEKSWKHDNDDFNSSMNCLEHRFSNARRYYNWILS